MSFTALNLSAEDAAFDAEEHTRELQIEQALKVFQEGLKAQKENHFDEANVHYKELFDIDVIKDSYKSAVSPTIRMLRYLAYRNRGLLRYEELRSKSSSLTHEEGFESLLISINDFTECLQYSDGDPVVVSLLLSVFKLFKNNKLTRFTIEYELTKEENKDLILNVRNRQTSHDFLTYVNEEKILLEQIGELESTNTEKKLPELPKLDLSFLDFIPEALIKRQVKTLENQIETLILEEVTWKSIAQSLNNLLPRSKFKNSNFGDPYNNIEEPIVHVKFIIPNSDVHSQDVELVEVGVVEEKDEANSTNEVEEIFPPEVVIEVESEAEERTEKRPLPDDVPQRSSKRVRQLADTEVASEIVPIDFDSFVNSFNLALTKADVKLDLDPSSVLNFESNSEKKYISDFYYSLQNWTSKLTELLLQSSSKENSEVSLVELLNSSAFTNSSSADLSISEDANDLPMTFVVEVQATPLHYIHVRRLFLEKVLSFENGYCTVLDEKLEDEAFSAIENMILVSENSLYDFLEASSNISDLSFSVSLFEIFVNHYISIKQKLKGKGLSQKQQSDFNNIIEHQTFVILRWRRLIIGLLNSLTDDVCSARFRWAYLLFLQHQNSHKIDFIQSLFAKFQEDFNAENEDLKFLFPNYIYIPSLTKTAIKAQSDKLKIVTTFEKSLNCEDEEESEGIVSLLESLLLPSVDLDRTRTEMEESMGQFINESSAALRLRLWKMLFELYQKNLNLESLAKGLLPALSFLIDQLISPGYNEQTITQRQATLLTVLSYYGQYIDIFVKTLEAQKWQVSLQNNQLLGLVLKYLEILYPYFIFEKSLGAVDRPLTRASMSIRDTIISTLCTIVLLYSKFVDNLDEVFELFGILHYEVGELGFCGAGSNLFLKLLQFFLKDASHKKYEPHVLQLLSCRYNLLMTSDIYSPIHHEVTPVSLDKESAFQFSSYILETIANRKNVLQSVPKQELKNALDALYNSIGDPEDDPIFKLNENTLDTFLESFLESRLFRNAYLGHVEIEFLRHTLSQQTVYDKGLYYFEGLSNLNLYKLRKKSAQQKASDLEYVIKSFRADLSSGTNRLESWIFLGQSYSLQVEDDLTWTSDKLNSPEKKLLTANSQRRAILCYISAISLVVNSKDDIPAQLKSTLFSSYSKELYHALSTPMNALPFLKPFNDLVLTDNTITGSMYSISDDKANYIRKNILKSLKVAIQLDPDDWTNYFYLGKVLHKLGKPESLVFNALQKCCELNNTGIEVRYQLCTFLYKYVKAGKLDEQTAIKKLSDDQTFGDLVVSDTYPDKFLNVLLAALRKLVSIDKKKWHHKPKFKIAHIYFELGEYKLAHEEIESLIGLKSTSKNLVNIWKPEHEPPGKHFVYTRAYILFYVKLANKLADFYGLLLFTRKLRRYGASMIDLPSAWDITTATVCNLTKEIVRAEPGFTDIKVPKLVFSEFVSNCNKLIDHYKEGTIKEEDIQMFVLLFEIYEIRRMNNGFGSTSLIDDTFNTIFLKIYLKEIENKTDNQVKESLVGNQAQTPGKSTGNNSTVKVKVARRDILAFAASLSKVVEPKIKHQKVSDDHGFVVPSDIVDQHILYIEPKTRENSVAVSLQETPNSTKPSETPVSGNRIDKDNVKVIDESEDEFHTPQNSSFEIVNID